MGIIRRDGAEFYPVPEDGVNNHRNLRLFDLDTGIRDDQEVVDFFEAQMRTVGRQPGIGSFGALRGPVPAEQRRP